MNSFFIDATCLRMVDDGGDSAGAGETNTEQQQQQQQGETTAAAGAAVDDILNSPAFLKRKLDVLKSDIEKIETDLEDALERAEVAKEEWGPQLEDLQREVRSLLPTYLSFDMHFYSDPCLSTPSLPPLIVPYDLRLL
jgi:hypothetical protein